MSGTPNVAVGGGGACSIRSGGGGTSVTISAAARAKLGVKTAPAMVKAIVKARH